MKKKVLELQKAWGEVIPVQANLASSDGAEQLWDKLNILLMLLYTHWEEYFGLVTDVTNDELDYMVELREERI